MLDHRKIKLVLLISLSVIGATSCKKYVEINPPSNSITSETVYSSNVTAAAAVTGIYSQMMQASGSMTDGNSCISLLCALQSDELKNYATTNSNYVHFYTNSLTSSNNGTSNAYFWNELYGRIYATNIILEGLRASTALTDSIKQQLIGETEFLRAFFYFYAVNLYGDVPLALSSNYKVNSQLFRTSQSKVYEQIEADLNDAKTKLSSHYVDYQGLPTTARVRPNMSTSMALLARVYLYQQKWDSASALSSLLINDTKYNLPPDLTSIFKAATNNSNEAIWQLQPVVAGRNTWSAQYLVLTGAPGTSGNNVAISSNLKNAFESGDRRKTNWIHDTTFSGNSYSYAFKYRVNLANQPVTEYFMVFRLAEQYLIRAEARAQLGDLNGAIADLNMLRLRANLPLLNAASMNQTQVLVAVMQERRVELFTEWGHRWFDLKRTGQLDAFMGGTTGICQAKGGTWSPNWALMPLPLSELILNSNLTQNPGY